MFATDDAFRHRKRNRGNLSRSVLHKDLADEVHVIFLEQQKHHNDFATHALRDDFLRIAFCSNARCKTARTKLHY